VRQVVGPNLVALSDQQLAAGLVATITRGLLPRR